MASPANITAKMKTSSQKLLNELIEQDIHVIPLFTLECGAVLKDAPVAYKTWGRLNTARDNAMVICHALTGSADVQDWWGPMMGRGKAFDPSRFFIICLNVLGSPYGTASPLTTNPKTGKRYGPDFPPTTIRDDVRIHKLVLDHLDVASIAAVIGGSMGGMHVLEWPLCTSPGYVRHIVPLATSASHSAWCIAWGEAQRQALCADPAFTDGWYDEQPRAGLAAARVCAMLTYRSRTSFGLKFGRRKQVQKGLVSPPKNVQKVESGHGADALTPPPSPPVTALKELKTPAHTHSDNSTSIDSLTHVPTHAPPIPKHTEGSSFSLTSRHTPISSLRRQEPSPPTSIFSAQSYLRYQGQKFLARFDANCLIHITHKMDTHDIARGRPAPAACLCAGTRTASPTPSSSSSSSSSSSYGCASYSSPSSDVDVDPELDTDPDTRYVLARLPPRPLVIGISSDNLFVPAEQRLIAAHIPGASFVLLDSIDGHDGFLLEFEEMNRHIVEFLRREEPRLYVGEVKEQEIDGFEVRKTSVFGEAEVEVRSVDDEIQGIEAISSG